MFANLFWVFVGLVLAGVIWFVVLGVKKGWSYTTTGVGNWFNSGVNAVKSDVASLQADVAKIKTQLNLK